MTAQFRKEVSLDSQGGSLGNSRLTLNSRDAALSVKSVSIDLVDESVQVDLSADTITYDSDDEMVKRRVGILRNKKGHPIYSREDIREQYCINRKELEVLENAKGNRFFGCLAGQQSSSPCTKNSILFSCMQKSKDSSIESLKEGSSSFMPLQQMSSGGGTSGEDSFITDGAHSARNNGGYNKMVDASQDSADDEFADSGFRRRPKTFCFGDPKNRYSWVDGDTQDTGMTIVSSRGPLSCSTSLASASQYSIDTDGLNVSGKMMVPPQRPSHLNILKDGGTKPDAAAFSPSPGAETPSDASTTTGGCERERERKRSVEYFTGFRGSKTPDMTLEERRQKHVSFDSVSLVRSNTIGGGMEDVDLGPVATSTPLYKRQSSPDKQKSQERLLDGSVRSFDAISLTKFMGDTSPPSISSQKNMTHVPGVFRPRRASMKTQATQTEITFNAKHLIPAYLTLSPRATAHPRPRHRPSRPRSTSKLTKSRSEYGGVMGSEDSEDEVMEVDLVSKHQRIIRPFKLPKKGQYSLDEKSLNITAPVRPTVRRSYSDVPHSDFNRANQESFDKSAESLIERHSEDRISPIIYHLHVRSPARRNQLNKPITTKIISSENILSYTSVASLPTPPLEKLLDSSRSDLNKLVPSPTGTTGSDFYRTKDMDTVKPEVLTSLEVDVAEVSKEDLDPSPSRSEVDVEKDIPIVTTFIDGDNDVLDTTNGASTCLVSSAQIDLQLDQPLRLTLAAPVLEISPSSEDATIGQVSDLENVLTPVNEQLPPPPPPAMVQSSASSMTKSQTQKRTELEKRFREAVEQHRKSMLLERVGGKPGDFLTSPESETSSCVFTERETSRSEFSSSSSSWVPKSESSSAGKGRNNNEGSETSSEYVTATEHSFRFGGSKRSGERISGGSAPNEEEGSHTSFETASSASLFSSPSSRSGRQSIEDSAPKEKAKDSECGIPSVRINEDKKSGHHDKGESSEESTPKKKSSDSDSPSIDLSLESPRRNKPRNVELSEGGVSEGGELTPVAEPSPEPSSMQETQTVIEKWTGLLENQSQQNVEKETDTDTDSSVSGGLPLADELSIQHFVERRPRSPEELSTVSEVSDEISHSDTGDNQSNHSNSYHKSSSRAASRSGDFQGSLGTEGTGETVLGAPSKLSVSSETSDTTTTSGESTTSGSFVLDTCSYTEGDHIVCLSEGYATMVGRREPFDDVNEPESSSSLTTIEQDLSESKDRQQTSPNPSLDSKFTSSLSITTDSFTNVSDETQGREVLSVVEQTTDWTVPDLHVCKGAGAIPKLKLEPVGNQDAYPKKEVVSRKYSLDSSLRQPSRYLPESASEDAIRKLDGSRSSDKVGDEDGRVFCSQCGEKVRGDKPNPLFVIREKAPQRLSTTSVTSEDQATSTSMSSRPFPKRPPFGMRWGEDDVFDDEDEDAGKELHPDVRISLPSDSLSALSCHSSLHRTSSSESTSSEQEFRKLYQTITHRMVHRKSSVEMYKRLSNRALDIDKYVVIQRNNGEFGFRIHGSRPVVVSAIEKGTPAETCGLEIGDIIISINGVNVLEASHSEVVRLAHTGADILHIEVARTCHILSPVITKCTNHPLHCGFLQRLSTGGGTTQRWCRRWFVLKDDNCLYWYRSDQEQEPLGALVLLNHIASWVPEAGSQHAFSVSKYGGGTQYYFATDDEETASRWISALNQVASTASQVDPYLESCLKNFQLPGLSISNPDCHGYLGKLGQRWKVWRRRYFVLKDGCLYFYTDRGATTALGMFMIHGYRVQSCTVVNKKNTFELLPPETRLRHLYFIGESENDKKRWLAAFEYSIDRWIKASENR